MALFGCRNLTVENNVVVGSIVANGDASSLVSGNSILAKDGDCPDATISLLSASSASIVDNTLSVDGSTCRPVGINIWGHDEGYPFSHNVLSSSNAFKGPFDPIFRGKPFHGGIMLDGVDGVVIEDNSWTERPRTADNVCECCRYGLKVNCKNITIKKLTMFRCHLIHTHAKPP
eukprot:COSAG02_NODE_1622_length_11607_cov_6.986097_11_plen_174_part_00